MRENVVGNEGLIEGISKQGAPKAAELCVRRQEAMDSFAVPIRYVNTSLVSSHAYFYNLADS